MSVELGGVGGVDSSKWILETSHFGKRVLQLPNQLQAVVPGHCKLHATDVQTPNTFAETSIPNKTDALPDCFSRPLTEAFVINFQFRRWNKKS